MSWFTPKSPVDSETKEWIENAFDWLIEELGVDTLRSVEMILPTDDFFPDVYDGSRATIDSMVDRVCEYMDVDPELVDLRYFENDDGSRFHSLASEGSEGRHAIGTYHMGRDGKYKISLDTSQARDPQTLVATIAHELGHVILLGEERLDPEYADHEPMTDLLTVFYGFGIFSANSSFVFEQWTNAQFQGWRAGGSGYLSEEMYGYSLAMFAYLRQETNPAWEQYLKTNVKSYFRSALKFINSTDQTRLAKYL